MARSRTLAVGFLAALLALGSLSLTRAQDGAPSADEVERAFETLRRAIEGQGAGQAEAAPGRTWSIAQLRAFLRREGYAVVNSDETTLTFKAQGSQLLLIRDDDGDLQLFFAVAVGHKNDYERVNAWNRGKRFSRAYVDGDGDYALEADLLAGEHLGEQRLRQFLSIFVRSVGAYRSSL